MTNSQRIRESAVMISSTMPSAKYSCSGSPLISANGSTAIDGLSGRAGPELARADAAPAAVTTRYAETGSDVDAIAKDIAVLDDDVADIDADAELDAALRRH